jgi:outer membrane immunogenic protein
MLRQIALAATLTVVGAASQAADLPSRSAAHAPSITAVPVFSWTGFYAGVNAGYAWGEFKESNSSITTDGTFPGLPPAPATYLGTPRKTKADGFLGGVQAGYNAQFGALVIGAEADYQFADLDSKTSYLGSIAGPYYATEAKLNQFGTLRARVGYAFDRVMVYGTGGLAVGQVKSSVAVTPGTTPIGATYAAGVSNTSIGYALGAGVEAALGTNWSVKGEYLYVDLGKENSNYAIGGGATATADLKTDAQIVRIGLNYRFN